ncbi:MAG: hypothetical protein AB7U63_05520 [Porticoccaceae bacterium]
MSIIGREAVGAGHPGERFSQQRALSPAGLVPAAPPPAGNAQRLAGCDNIRARQEHSHHEKSGNISAYAGADNPVDGGIDD